MVILLQVLRIITAPFDLQRKNYYVTQMFNSHSHLLYVASGNTITK